jgi:hypothetical protein
MNNCEMCGLLANDKRKFIHCKLDEQNNITSQVFMIKFSERLKERYRSKQSEIRKFMGILFGDSCISLSNSNTIKLKRAHSEGSNPNSTLNPNAKPFEFRRQVST